MTTDGRVEMARVQSIHQGAVGSASNASVACNWAFVGALAWLSPSGDKLAPRAADCDDELTVPVVVPEPFAAAALDELPVALPSEATATTAGLSAIAAESVPPGAAAGIAATAAAADELS